MKKLMVIVIAVMLPLLMSAQAQINTKKAIVSDFPSKVMKVVLTGNGILDVSIVEAVKDCWRLSPYEFCTLDEFRALMDSDEYYFLLVVDTKFRREVAPGLKMLTLIKGGKRAEKGIGKMFEVVSVPFCSSDEPSGRELVFLPVFVEIVQERAETAMEKEVTARGGLGVISRNIDNEARLVLAEGDVSFDVEELTEGQRDRLEVLDDDDVDELFLAGVEGVLVSYSIYPTAGEVGSYCYNMLIDAKSHKLCYFRRYKIGPKTGVGFNSEDLNKIF